jgi:hypothetical protein
MMRSLLTESRTPLQVTARPSDRQPAVAAQAPPEAARDGRQPAQWLAFLGGHGIHPKLTVSDPGDPDEREADAVADRVMRMSDPGASAAPAVPQISRKCGQCAGEADEELKAKRPGPAQRGGEAAPRGVEAALHGPGEPLAPRERAFFEPRFGRDFGAVRVHSDASSAEASRRLGAQAFAYGSHIYFGAGRAPGPNALTAHELAHVVQQGGAPRLGEAIDARAEPRPLARRRIQRAPGDGMVPPGDCDWSDYIPLRIAKETAVAVSEGLGACAAGDSCWRLAFKIAAFSAEIAAREAVAVTCFRGGDQGHIDQIANKVRALETCMTLFGRSNCSPDLIAAARVVVEQIRSLLATLLVTVAVVAIVALIVLVIAAIIALLELIAAALAALAAGAAEAGLVAGVAALIALLISLNEGISGDDDA